MARFGAAQCGECLCIVQCSTVGKRVISTRSTVQNNGERRGVPAEGGSAPKQHVAPGAPGPHWCSPCGLQHPYKLDSPDLS